MKNLFPIFLTELLVLSCDLSAAPNEHAEDDTFWEQASALLPGFSGTPAAPALSTRPGLWGPVLPWSHTPVTIAVLPNGKLLTYAGQEPEYWPGTKTQTHWGLWNPDTGQFANQLYTQHEMFCSHPVMRTDGILQTMGGRYTVRDSSTYDWRTNRWQRTSNLNDRRWYTTSVALPDGDVATFGGQGGPNTAERYNHKTNLWSRLAGIDWQPVSTAAGFASQNWPFLMVAPDGRLFHFGPTDTMHWVNPEGSGSRVSAGITVPGNNYPKDGAIVMYDSGKYLVAGGAAVPTNAAASRACYTVDLNTTPPTVQSTPQMAFARSHHNLVALPSGEVLVIGGNTSGQRFSDVGTILAAEVWNPATRAWRTLSSMTTPRNYHSTAALLPDGRVFSGGGGYHPSNPNHPATHTNAEIFTPPALLNNTNTPRSRPVLTTAPEAITLGSIFSIQASAGLNRFVMTRMIATTHGNTSDQRFLNIPFTETSSGNYELVSNPKKNVMVPGYWMLWGVQANGSYSKARIIHVKETSDAANSGLTAQYFNGTNFNTLRETRTDHAIDFNYGLSSPLPDLLGNDTFSIRWTGWVTPDFSERYTFYTNTDDGARLWVNGRQLVNDWQTQAATENSGSINLQAGVPVAITFEYFQGSGAAIAQLRWSSSRTPKAIIPSRSLSTSRNDNEAFVAADNRHELFINGKLVNVGVRWQETLRSTFQTQGKTTLAIRALDSGGSGGAIGHFTINGETITTSSAWKVSRTAPAGWNQPGFDDRNWTNATEHAAAGTGSRATGGKGLPANTPAKWIWSSDNNGHNQVFLRFTIGIPELAPIPNQSSITGNTVNLLPSATAASNSTLAYSASNLPPGLSINASSGRITGIPSASGIFNSSVTVTDQDGSNDTRNFSWVVRLPGQGSGSLLRELWLNAGNPADTTSPLLSNLTSDPRYPLSPTQRDEVSSFPVGTNSGDYYGTRLRGYIHAPISGNYTFWLSTDNEGSLVLGNSESATGASEIASVPGFTAINEWTKYPSQRSIPIPLVAGQKYYLEILQKEQTGGDHINLAWTLPGDSSRSIVDGSYLSPWVINQPPAVNAIPNRENTMGTNINFRPIASDPDGDTLTFTATGLPDGISLNTATGRLTGNTDVPGIYEVRYTATDPQGLRSTRDFDWTVNDILILPDPISTPVQTGQDATFNLAPTGGTNVSYRWNFGDGSPEVTSSSTSINHRFTQPGRYTITVTATDANGNALSKNFLHLAHPPLTTLAPRNSQPVLTFASAGNEQAWNVNPDQNTVSVFDLASNAKLAETSVGNNPVALAQAPDGRIWVTNKKSASLSVLDPTNHLVVDTISLPLNCHPHGIVFSPNGNAAWVALEALGEVARLNVNTGAIVARYPVRANARHLAVSSNSSRLYISHFISPPVAGEGTATVDVTSGGGFITVFRPGNPSATSSIRLQASTTEDFGGGGRGIPNYLGPLAISPAGDFGWIPSKQDNIERGMLRSGQQLDHDNTVRTITSQVNLGTAQENYLARIDHDDAGVPSSAIYGPYGLHVFVAIEGSREIAVIDAYGQQELFRFATGRAPQGLALSPDGSALFVHNFLSRTITIHDISSLVENGLQSVAITATLDPTGEEALASNVLLGKQLFYDALDDRLSRADYMSCASCHNDGDHDGRTWDFTGFGEGLRNTIDLRGRGGEEHGPLHWSANFDEFQDFENQIRNFAEGTGLLNGTPHPSLGTPNGGRSADLDALAAYLGSLTKAPASPFRKSDGGLTPEALAGKDIFVSKGCVECHSGPAFTDSGSAFHNVGTLSANSGQRLGSTLPGLDTPSLLGAWAGSPYLHDGSRNTLAGAITAHQGASLTNSELDSLVAYLQQLDGSTDEVPVQTLAFGGIPTSLPGRLEVENYDTGGPGISFSDTNPENFGANFGINYRDEGVDLEAANDLGGTASMGWIEDGEWTQYTVNLTAGTYELAARASSALAIPGSIRVLLDGVPLGEIDVESTGGWYLWQDFTLPDITVSSGQAVLRLEYRGASFNLNWLELRDPSVTPPPPVDNQTPFGGTAATIPGKIEAENFDEGGAGIAYLDSEEENFGLTYTDLDYRTSGVDIEASFDTNATPSIGWTDPGEWLEYSVQVIPGTYDLQARVASGFALPGELAVELDGRNLGVIPVSGTGDWYNWETITIPDVSITENGQHVLRLKFAGAAGFNLNWIKFDDGSTTPPPPSGQSPFGGIAHTIPGRIQAEDYDLGGEGVAYSDADPENFGGSYRGEGVDIETSGDSDGSFSVGWFDDAQWMEYTLAVTPGIYRLDLRVASNETVVGNVQITLDGEALGIIDVQSTGAWDNWVTLSLPSVTINDTSEKVLRLEMIGDAVNVNWFEFTRTAAASNIAFATIQQVGRQADPMEDSDGDSTSNLAEFAFGSDAGEAGSQPLLPLGFDHEGNCCQTVPVAVGGIFGQNTYRAAGVVYTFQGSSDLGNWTESITFIPNPPGIPAPPAGYRYVTFRLTETDHETGFLRVLVTEEN